MWPGIRAMGTSGGSKHWPQSEEPSLGPGGGLPGRDSPSAPPVPRTQPEASRASPALPAAARAVQRIPPARWLEKAVQSHSHWTAPSRAAAGGRPTGWVISTRRSCRRTHSRHGLDTGQRGRAGPALPRVPAWLRRLRPLPLWGQPSLGRKSPGCGRDPWWALCVSHRL